MPWPMMLAPLTSGDSKEVLDSADGRHASADHGRAIPDDAPFHATTGELPALASVLGTTDIQIARLYRRDHCLPVGCLK